MQDKSKEEVLKILKTQESGLTAEEAFRRLQTDGPNELIEKKKKNYSKCF